MGKIRTQINDKHKKGKFTGSENGDILHRAQKLKVKLTETRTLSRMTLV